MAAGNVLQGDFNTIHNHYYSTKVGAKPEGETTDSATTIDEEGAQATLSVKFIVPRSSTPYFTGRSVQLTQLQDFLSDPPDNGLSRRIVMIVGTGGAGKTQFCLKYAETHQSRCVNQFKACSVVLTSLQVLGYLLDRCKQQNRRR